MSDKRLRCRISVLELERCAPTVRMVIRPDEQVPIGTPVVMMPMLCTTADDWLAKHGPEANHG